MIGSRRRPVGVVIRAVPPWGPRGRGEGSGLAHLATIGFDQDPAEHQRAERHGHGPVGHGVGLRGGGGAGGAAGRWWRRWCRAACPARRGPRTRRRSTRCRRGSRRHPGGGAQPDAAGVLDELRLGAADHGRERTATGDRPEEDVDHGDGAAGAARGVDQRLEELLADGLEGGDQLAGQEVAGRVRGHAELDGVHEDACRSPRG